MNLGKIDEKLSRFRAEEEDYLEAKIDIVTQIHQKYRWTHSAGSDLRPFRSSMPMAKYIRLREDDDDHRVRGYTYDYYLKVIPYHPDDTTYFCPITVSEAASFVDYNCIYDKTPTLSNNTVEYIRSKTNIHIKDFRTVKIQNELTSRVSLTTGESSFNDNRRGFGKHHRGSAVHDAKIDLRNSWAKQEGYTFLECTVSEHKTTYYDNSKLSVQHPSWRTDKKFKIDSEDADEEHIRAFADEVGGGLLENTEGETVIVSVKDYNNSVAKTEGELYLYAPSQFTKFSRIKNRTLELISE